MSDKYWIEYLESKSPVNYDDYLESNLAARDRRIVELDAELHRMHVLYNEAVKYQKMYMDAMVSYRESSQQQEARSALLKAENQRLRESAPDLERTKIAMAMYRGHAVLSWDEAWAGTLLQEQEE